MIQRPVSLGLNSKVVKKNGEITEEVYKSGGKYGTAIDKIIFGLKKLLLKQKLKNRKWNYNFLLNSIKQVI